MSTTPGKIRSKLEKIKSELSELEAEISVPIQKGVVALSEVSFEISESCDGVERALEILDKNYGTLS